MRNSFSQNMVALDASVSQVGVTMDGTSALAASAVAVVTGTSSGTLYFEVSNDPPSVCTTDTKGKLQPVNWVEIGAGAEVVVSGAGTFLIPKFDCAYQWMRTQWVKNNGASGTITVNVNTKGF